MVSLRSCPPDPVIQDEGFRAIGGHAHPEALEVSVVCDLVALGWWQEVLEQSFGEALRHEIRVRTVSARKEVLDEHKLLSVSMCGAH
jgi:hypothetical protein